MSTTSRTSLHETRSRQRKSNNREGHLRAPFLFAGICREAAWVCRSPAAPASPAKRLHWTIDQLIRKVEEILAYEHDEAEIERLNESIDFIRENW